MDTEQSQKQRKILLAEDDLFIRELYERAMIKFGYNIVAAEDGEQAISFIKSVTGLDLILLDVMMPKMDGLSVLKKLRDEKVIISAPVIMLTNLGEESVIRETKDLGVVGYLVKMNFTPKQLIEKIENYFTSGVI